MDKKEYILLNKKLYMLNKELEKIEKINNKIKDRSNIKEMKLDYLYN